MTAAPLPTLLWFRRDLRLNDNPALRAALRQGRPVIPIFVLDEENARRQLGGAARWWLGQSLIALDGAITRLGGRLILRSGSTLAILREIISESRASSLHFNRRYDPPGLGLDRHISAALREEGIAVEDHPPNYLHEPWQMRTGQDGFFKVFTPFFRSLSQQVASSITQPPPDRWPAPEKWPRTEAVEMFRYEPRWSRSLANHWQPGENGARRQLDRFLDDGIENYAERRDYPAAHGTSRLSPHLAWGELSVQTAWQRVRPEECTGAAAFRRELAWRDFNMHLYFHYQALPHAPWRENFRNFPFRKSTSMLQSWQHGRTGFPLVDAGMRELQQTGWMHNRLRMVTASFLVKDQLIDWREGEAWFWDMLVDADPAQNAGNWQWVAGCGFDASPFFRIFNPVTQSEKFDPQGSYIRQWLPELGKLADKDIHRPWELSADRLSAAGIRLGITYPRPVLDHATARQEALRAYRAVSGKSAEATDLFT